MSVPMENPTSQAMKEAPWKVGLWIFSAVRGDCWRRGAGNDAGAVVSERADREIKCCEPSVYHSVLGMHWDDRGLFLPQAGAVVWR